MKKKQTNALLLFAIVLFASLSVQSQEYKIAASLSGGYVANGIGGMVSIDYKTNTYDFLKVAIVANATELAFRNIEVPVDIYALQLGYFFGVLRSHKRTVALAIGVGGTVGNERINKGEAFLENENLLTIDPDKIIYGLYVGIDADVFVAQSVAITVDANETYHLNSDLGDFIPYVGLGLKFIIK